MPLASLFSKQKKSKLKPTKTIYDNENVTFQEIRRWMLSTENLPKDMPKRKTQILNRDKTCLKKFKRCLNQQLLDVVKESKKECKIKMSRGKKSNFLR